MITVHRCHRQAVDLPGFRRSPGQALVAVGGAGCAHVAAVPGRSLRVAGGVILLAPAVWMVAAATSPLVRAPVQLPRFPLAVPCLLNPVSIAGLVTSSAEAGPPGGRCWRLQQPDGGEPAGDDAGAGQPHQDGAGPSDMPRRARARLIRPFLNQAVARGTAASTVPCRFRTT